MTDLKLGTISMAINVNIRELELGLEKANKVITRFSKNLASIFEGRKKVDFIPAQLTKQLQDTANHAHKLANAIGELNKAGLLSRAAIQSFNKQLRTGKVPLQNLDKQVNKTKANISNKFGKKGEYDLSKIFRTEKSAMAGVNAEINRLKTSLGEAYTVSAAKVKGVAGGFKQLAPVITSVGQKANMTKQSMDALTTSFAKSGTLDFKGLFKTKEAAFIGVQRYVNYLRQELGPTFTVTDAKVRRVAGGFKQLSPTISQARQQVEKIVPKMGAGLWEATAKSAGGMKNLMKVAEQQRKKFQKLHGETVRVQIQFGRLASGAQGAFLTMKHVGDQSLGAVMKRMLGFRSFMAKVMHYITFSVGVQLVMRLNQSFRQLIETFSNFERAATNAATISGFLGSSFESVKQHIMSVSRELGRTTVFSAMQVAQSFYTLASAGYDVSKMTAKELGPILDYAAATQSELDEATKAILVTLKQFKMELSDTAHVADVFTTAITTSFQTMEKLKEGMKFAGPMAGILGVSLEETTSALTALVDRGLEGGQAGQRLNMIFTKLLKPTKQATDMLMNLGLTYDDINPKTHSLTQILYTLQAAGFGAAEAATMFRARTAGAAAVLVENADAVARMATRLEMAEGITRKVAAAQEDTLWGALTKTTNKLIEMATNVGENLSPIIIGFADVIQKSLVPLLTFLGGIFKFISSNALIFKVALGSLLWLTVLYYTKAKLIPMVLKLWGKFTTLLTFAKKALLAITQANIVAWRQETMSAWMSTKATMGATAAVKALGVAMLANPVTWFVAAIGLIAATTIYFATQGKKLTKVQNDINASMTPLIAKYAEFDDKLESGAMSVQGFHTHMFNLGRALSFIDKQASDEYFIKLAEAMGITFDEAKQLQVLNEDELAIAKQVVDGLDVEYLALVKNTEARHATIDSLDKYEIALYNSQNATAELTEATKAFNAAGGDTIDNRERLIKAEKDYARTQNDLIKYAGRVVQAMRTIPGNLEFYIDALEKSADAQYRLIQRNKDMAKINHDVGVATRDLSDAMLEYGAGTEQAIEAESRLQDLLSSRMDIQKELDDLGMQADNTMVEDMIATGAIPTIEDMKDAQLELGEAERRMLGQAKEIIEFREALIQAKADEAMWTARLNALDLSREDSSKFLEERLLSLYEAQDKLFEIEAKLYRLRKDEDKQLDSLFQSLAEQGLINQDMVKQYADMKKAEGDVLKLNNQFSEAMSELTPNQRELVEAFMAGEKTQGDLADAGIANIDTFVAMKDAQDAYRGTIDNLSEDMTPLISNLVDMGVVSSDTAKQFYDLIDNAYELASGEKKLDKQNKEISDSFGGVLNVIGQLAHGLIDGESGANSMKDIWGELTTALGIGETSFDEIKALTGSTASSMGALTDEEFILAAALKATAMDLDLYQAGMNGANLAVDLGIVTTENLSSAYTLLRNQVTNIEEPMRTYQEVLFGVEDASKAVNQAMTGSDDGTGTGGLKGAVQSFASDIGVTVTDNVIRGLGLDAIESTENVDETHSSIMNIFNMAGIPEEHFLLKVQEYLGYDIDKALELEETMKRIKGMYGDPAFQQQGGSAGWSEERLNQQEGLRNIIRGIFGPAGWAGVAIGDWIMGLKKGGIAGLQRGITQTRGPTQAIIGERGAEAVVPLEGVNKKYGEKILGEILPKYFPKFVNPRIGDYQSRLKSRMPNLGGLDIRTRDIDRIISRYKNRSFDDVIRRIYGLYGNMQTMQTGGIVNNTTSGGDSYNENFTVAGPIYVTGIAEAGDFANKLKFSARAAGR